MEIHAPHLPLQAKGTRFGRDKIFVISMSFSPIPTPTTVPCAQTRGLGRLQNAEDGVNSEPTLSPPPPPPPSPPLCREDCDSARLTSHEAKNTDRSPQTTTRSARFFTVAVAVWWQMRRGGWAVGLSARWDSTVGRVRRAEGTRVELVEGMGLL